MEPQAYYYPVDQKEVDVIESHFLGLGLVKKIGGVAKNVATRIRQAKASGKINPQNTGFIKNMISNIRENRAAKGKQPIFGGGGATVQTADNFYPNVNAKGLSGSITDDEAEALAKAEAEAKKKKTMLYIGLGVLAIAVVVLVIIKLRK